MLTGRGTNLREPRNCSRYCIAQAAKRSVNIPWMIGQIFRSFGHWKVGADGEGQWTLRHMNSVRMEVQAVGRSGLRDLGSMLSLAMVVSLEKRCNYYNLRLST